MILTAAALDTPPFSMTQLDALFAAILIDDVVDAEAPLPDVIVMDYDARLLLDCFRICRQLWKEGVDRDELIQLIRTLARDGDLGPEDRLRFKYIRARFKHLRFAFALYGKSHRYPVLLDWVTTAMGHMQDAFKNGNRAAVAHQARVLHVLLSALPRLWLEREIDRFSPTGSAGFRFYVTRQIISLRAMLAHDAVTGASFHATRKIISRQVSFYDTLRTIEPSDQAFRMSRVLAAINGLMGSMHDELIERRVAGTQDYHRERFALPDEIKGRLNALVAHYPS